MNNNILRLLLRHVKKKMKFKFEMYNMIKKISIKSNKKLKQC